MELSDHASWEYLNGLSDPVRKQLSTLYITEALTLENLSVLRQHESSIRGTGLDSYSILTDIELIWIQSYDNPGSEIISSCSNLKSLIIAGWEPHYGDLLPLSKLSTLQTLTLAECGITDFSNIEFPPTLERLQIIDCATLSNITGLKDLRKLRGISFSGCPETEALIILNKKKSLRWLSFPENVSQSEFAAIVSSQTKLEVIELLNCHEIDNISPLKALPDLKILVLALPKEQLLDLGEMNQLELIILQAELFDLDPQWIGDLRSSLPDTQLVPGSGLCLGSGWLLLMLPLMLIFRYKFRHYR